MTSYNGQTITYDEIGNPLSYRDGMTMTWQNGRQLASLQKGNNSIQYSYDSEGIRVSKTINGEKCTFEYLNGMLLYETRGDKYFRYFYDSNGTLYAVNYRLTPNGTDYTYYYTHNWRGDIVGIYNGNGELRAKYTYDSWGNVTSIIDGNGNVITDQNHVGNLNPFRYRGYYMDTETGMYYLMSRYYDPVTHRFLNADGYFQTGLGILDGNMNAYCKNNPIMNYDPEGTTCREHGYQYISNCTKCNKEYRNYLNSHIDWYNNSMGLTGSDRVVGFNDSGDPIYAYSNATSSALSMTSTAVSFNTGTVFSIASTQGSRALSGGLAAATYAFTTPLNIVSQVTNPWIDNGQNSLLIGEEIAIATIDIVGSVLFVAVPISDFCLD